MPPLTGLQIQKLLPGTNCRECGLNTCLAFAMKLAGKNAELSECPDVSEEAKGILGAAAAPPIRTVTIGAGAETLCIELLLHVQAMDDLLQVVFHFRGNSAGFADVLEDRCGK